MDGEGLDLLSLPSSPLPSLLLLFFLPSPLFPLISLPLASLELQDLDEVVRGRGRRHPPAVEEVQQRPS